MFYGLIGLLNLVQIYKEFSYFANKKGGKFPPP